MSPTLTLTLTLTGGDQRAVLMDVTIGDPTCDSYIAKESHKVKL